jgi:Protein of unknown function (DUF2793)
MSNTSNLVLPFLAVGQAQKHVTVNESLRRLDAVVQLSVVSATTTAQPSSPADGSVYIVPAGKSGADWAAYANESLGYYRDGAWEQITPRKGWLAYVKDTDVLLVYGGAAWALFDATKLAKLSATDRVLGRVSSGAGAAEEITFTDQAQQLADDTSFQAMCATLGTWRVLAASAVAASHTGNTTETALATIALPAGAMGPNGVLRVTGVITGTNSANNKTWRLRLGGSGGTEFASFGLTTNGTGVLHRLISNRNNAASQVSMALNSTNAFGNSTTAPATGAIDTANAQDIVISGQLANASETVTLESYMVEVAYRA